MRSQPLVSQESTIGEALKLVGLAVVEGLLVNRRSGHRWKHRRLLVQSAREELRLFDPSPVKQGGH